MCLAVPMKLIEITRDGREGAVDMGGAPKMIGLQLCPEARVGDYVLVHAGMAIQVVAAAEAEETLRLFEEYARAEEMIEIPRDPHSQ
jgi:hydrogenase expression/formation protein HypC